MSNPRKPSEPKAIKEIQIRLLGELIKNKMTAILRAQEIFTGVGKSREKILNPSNREIERVSIIVASKVYNWIMKMRSSGKEVNGEMINNEVKKELERRYR